MKRSTINKIIQDSIDYITELGFALPPFAYWTREDWSYKGFECDEIRDNMLGWDITDFGSGDFDHTGLTLITIRNGNQKLKQYKKTYAEKILISHEEQKCPMHFHWMKTEDIINRGGGILLMQLYNSTETEELADTEVNIVCDGVSKKLAAGSILELLPGQSVTLTAGIYHSFWAKRGHGIVMIGEVSECNDDKTDNRFYDASGRFPQIEEDEEPLFYLCNEYPRPGFYPYAIDAHVHMFHCGLNGITELQNFQSRFRYAASNFLSVECMGDAAQNALGIYLKLASPGNYAFGGFHYRFDYSFAEEAKRLMEIGFDGIKMVENKPTLRKKLSMATNDPRYNELYAYMQNENKPMLIHVADPEEFWDPAQVPSWAIEAGYFYGDGTFITKERLYAEMLDVFNRFPKLNIILAHFFFMSADKSRLESLMEKYPNMHLDIVAGSEMYFNFKNDLTSWREFFLKYQERIIFGTDNLNLVEDEEVHNALITNRFEHGFICTFDAIPAWDKTVLGIGLPRDTQDKIFRTNFQRLAGKKPNEISLVAAIKYLEERLEKPEFKLTEREQNIITDVLNYCRKLYDKANQTEKENTI